jgi:gas vesicle protein
MKNSVGMLVSVFTAAAAGTAIGMLIAPAKGAELRKDIKDTAKDWSKKIGDQLTGDKDQRKDPETALGGEGNDYKYGNQKQKM